MKQRVERWVGVRVDDGDLVIDGGPARFALRDGALYVAKVSGRNTVTHERSLSGLRTSSSTGGTVMKSERLLAAVRY